MERECANYDHNEQLKKRLNSLQFAVTQENATEMPFQNEYWDNKREGIYVYQPVNGCYTVPELPGIGQDFTEKVFQDSDKILIK